MFLNPGFHDLHGSPLLCLTSKSSVVAPGWWLRCEIFRDEDQNFSGAADGPARCLRVESPLRFEPSVAVFARQTIGPLGLDVFRMRLRWGYSAFRGLRIAVVQSEHHMFNMQPSRDVPEDEGDGGGEGGDGSDDESAESDDDGDDDDEDNVDGDDGAAEANAADQDTYDIYVACGHIRDTHV